jgi:hypothetical protein
MTLGVHAPPMSDMHSVSAQVGGGAGARLFRLGNDMGGLQ